MNTKPAFTHSDVVAIMHRMARQQSGNGASGIDLSHAPTSPVAARLMREIGVSNEKMCAAYAIARRAVLG